MAVSPHFFFDDNGSGLLHEELEDVDVSDLVEYQKKDKKFWLSFGIVSFGLIASFFGVAVGLYANLEQRELVDDYLVSLGFESLPEVDESDYSSPVSTFDDTTVHALELDRWISRSMDLEKKLTALEDENRYLVMAKESLENVLDGEVLNFESDELGFSFEYPAKYGEVELVIDEPVEVNGTEWGGKFRGEFLNNSYLKFGGSAVNYGSDGKLRFLDYGRFDGKGFIGNAKLIEIIEFDGGRASVFRGIDNVKGALKNGELGALIDLNGDEFSALAFHVTSEKKFSYKELKAVLETLVVE